jgi:hypothetical protein
MKSKFDIDSKDDFTHLTNADIRLPEVGIISNSTTLRHIEGNVYEIRAGKVKGKYVTIPKQYVQKI